MHDIDQGGPDAKKKIVVPLLIAAIVVVFAGLIYYFPVQRAMAERKYAEYSRLQGVPDGDVASKSVHKDYKQDGYFIDVTYHSDPQYRYEYRYRLVDVWNDGVRFDTMTCAVYLDSTSFTGDVRYDPLE